MLVSIFQEFTMIAAVEAVKITGSTSKAESADITHRLRALADRKLKPDEKEIKLCYVTVSTFPRVEEVDDTILGSLR